MYGRRELSIQNIRQVVTGLDVFRYYCKPFKTLNKAFCSELRMDKNPTCSITYINGKFIYKDFATGETFDEVGYLRHKYGLSFIDSLSVINRDFNLNLATAVQNTERPTMLYFGVPDKSIDVDKLQKEQTYIKVKIRDWKNPDKNYWQTKYGFTSKQLRYFSVVPISYFWINDRMYSCKNNSYAYYLGNHEEKDVWKIYQPLEDRTSKWFTNASKNIVQGDAQLPKNGETLFITSSLKDVITLRKIGLFAIAPSSESTPLDDAIIEKYKARFKRLIVFYDNDEQGIVSANKHSKLYDCNYIMIPILSKLKDPSDFVEAHGYVALEEAINNELNNLKKDVL